MTILPLVLLGLLGAEEVIDGFEYADAQSARRAWVAKERTPPVDPIADAGRNVLKVAAPFAADARLRRTVIDRKVALDLSAPGRFELEVAVDPPEAVRYLNLYFRSGGGWYSSGKTTSGGGWRKLNFSKTSFRSEESPAGWNKIDAVRIAAWRG